MKRLEQLKQKVEKQSKRKQKAYENLVKVYETLTDQDWIDLCWEPANK